MIKGYPNKSGEVIVGYGIEEKYRRNGYATESLKRLIKWIFGNPKALCVIADTEKTNKPFHKVLENLGAIIYKEIDELVWWKIENNIWEYTMEYRWEDKKHSYSMSKILNGGN